MSFFNTEIDYDCFSQHNWLGFSWLTWTVIFIC